MSSCVILVCLGFFLSISIDLGYGFCLKGPLLTELTAFKRTRQYCTYKHEGNTINLLLGSAIYTADCIHCTCSQSGMSCCGFGHKAGVFSIGKDCVMKPDGCQPVFVKASNHSLDCFTGKPVSIGDPDPKLLHPDNMFSLKTSNRNMRGISTGLSDPPKPVRNRLQEVLEVLQNTKLAHDNNFHAPIHDIMSQMISAGQQPYWQDANMQQQHDPLVTSHQASVSYHNDGTTQDSGWFPWMFMMK